MIMIVVVTMMMVFGRTGRIIRLSTARLPMIATATLPVNGPPGKINRQTGHLLLQRHRLVQVG